MGAFRYQALNAKGKVVKGTLEGDTERHIRAQLREQQLKPIRVDKVIAGLFSSSTDTAGGDTGLAKARTSKVNNIRISVKDLTLFTRQLASLVQSGMPLSESLQSVAKQTRKDSVKDIVLQVRSRVQEGRSLAQSFAEFPRVFDSMYRAMVHAGEQAGFLGPVLERLSEYAETSHAARQQLKSAMVYPTVLLVVCIAIVVALMVAVVPQLVSVFANSKQALPWYTLLLINISEFLQYYGIVCLAGIIAVVMGFKRWLHNEKNLGKYHGWQLKTPLLRDLVVQSDSTRFASTLSMLLNSGVPLLNSLRISTQTMGNTILRDKAEQAAVSVEGGASLNRALDKADVFPPLMVQMAASGEANGTVAEQLDYSARSQQRELDIRLSTMLGIIEPLTIVVMGAIIGFIMTAIIIPITSMSDSF